MAKFEKAVQQVCCMNNLDHAVGFCDISGFYCHECDCDHDRDIILVKTSKYAGELVDDDRKESFLKYVRNGDRFEGVKQYE